MKYQTLKEKNDASFAGLKGEFGYKNKMQAPHITKVVISSGIGSIQDKQKKELIGDRLAKITGQKAASRQAKKSIATFKLRQGDVVGYQVTLRGARMWGFLEKLFNIAFPRTRDFKGVANTVVDDIGNLTVGIKEHTVFPEVSDEELKNVFGMAITIGTTAKTRKEALAFFTYLGFPFKK